MIDYEKMEKRVQKTIKSEKKLDHYAIGGYPLLYITGDNRILCPNCANQNIELLTNPDDHQWYIVGYDINYEDRGLYCDHCYKRIESAHGED